MAERRRVLLLLGRRAYLRVILQSRARAVRLTERQSLSITERFAEGEAVQRRDRRAREGRMAKQSAWRRFSDYVRHDLREIVWPRPMPDPPNTRYITDLSFKQHVLVWRDAIRAYADGWRLYHGEPEAEKAKRRAEERAARAEDAGDPADGPDGYVPDPDDDTTFKDEFGRIIRVGRQVGFQGWKQQIQHFYQTRGRAYRDAMKEFVAGYKEGIREAAAPPRSSGAYDAERAHPESDPTDFDSSQTKNQTPPSGGNGAAAAGTAAAVPGGQDKQSKDTMT